MKKSLLNTMFDDISLFTFKEGTKLRTDIKEYANQYVFEIDVAGHDKKDIDIRIEDYYMIVEVKSSKTFEEVSEENSDSYQYVRKERFVGSTSRSYYVGDVLQKDIKASFNNGLLTIIVPKKEENNRSTKIKID